MVNAPDPAISQKRRSFLVLLVALIVGVALVAFVLRKGGDGAAAGTPTPGASGSATGGAVTLQSACAEIPPDLAFRVDALRRTAALVRADVVTMQGAGNTADAAKATEVADALDAAADAENSQKGVRRATRKLGQTLASVC